MLRINGFTLPLKRACAFSDVLRILLSGPFADAQKEEYMLHHDLVPQDSEAWHYYLGRSIDQPDLAARKGSTRWHHRYFICNYLNGGGSLPSFWHEDFHMLMNSADQISDFNMDFVLSLDFVVATSYTREQFHMRQFFENRTTEDLLLLALDMWKTETPAPLLIAWSHILLSRRKASPEIGNLATHVEETTEAFRKYLREASGGLLPFQKWPDGVVLSGGALVNAYFQLPDTQVPAGRDFDLWIWDESRFEDVMAEIVRDFQFSRPDVKFLFWVKPGNIIDILVPDADFHIQVLARAGGSPWSIPLRFDLDYVRVYMAEETSLHIFPECKLAWKHRKVSWHNPAIPLKQERLRKATHKGFQVDKALEDAKTVSGAPTLWLHPKKSDPLDYVTTLAKTILPTSEIVLVPPTFKRQLPKIVTYENDGLGPGPEFLLPPPTQCRNINNMPEQQWPQPPIHYRILTPFRYKYKKVTLVGRRRENDDLKILTCDILLEPHNVAHRSLLQSIHAFEAKLLSEKIVKRRRDYQFRVSEELSTKTLELRMPDDCLVHTEDQGLLERKQGTFPENRVLFGEIMFSVNGLWKGRNDDNKDVTGIYFHCERITEFSSATAAEHRLQRNVQDMQIICFEAPRPPPHSSKG